MDGQKYEVKSCVCLTETLCVEDEVGLLDEREEGVLAVGMG